MPRKGAAPAADTTEETAEAAPAKPTAAAVDITLPPLSDFDNIEVPEYETSFTRKQGEGKEPRKFSAKGPKAEAIIRVLFGGGGQYSRQQIADIVGCSASRVTEIIWALEVTVEKNSPSWEIPAVPRAKRAKKEDAAEPAAEAAAE